MEGLICPKCGKRTVMKKEVKLRKYKLVCSKCGFQQCILPKDDKKRGFV